MEESRGQFALFKVHQQNKPGEGLLAKERKDSMFKYLLNSTKLTMCLKTKRLLFHFEGYFNMHSACCFARRISDFITVSSLRPARDHE
jgi:hypothetical protein